MKLIERRVGLLFAAFTIAFLLVMVRAAWLQVARGDQYSDSARSQQVATVEVPGMRGSILDRNGETLAGSEDAATISVTPYQIEDPPQAAELLAKKLDLKADDVLAKLTADSGFEYVAQKVDVVTAEQIERLDLVGVNITRDTRRTYPQGEIAGRVIGAIGTEGTGLFGLEAAQEKLLAPSDGELAVTRDALGEEIHREVVEPAEAGSDLQLTIDGEIQAETEQVLDQIGATYKPAGATIIAVDPRDSSVLAMASWPPVDPNNLEEAPEDVLSNMATGFTYEPGSTFKAFTVAGAVEDGIVTPRTTFNLAPTINVADRTIGESHERGTITASVAQILAESSNVGTVTVGLELGAERFSEWVDEWGFGAPTGIDYPGEEQGIVLPYADYSGSSIGNMPIGQGISVTPLQMVAGYSAIANGGILRPPRLIESVDGETQEVADGRRVISEKTASQVREMLEGVLAPGGTAAEVEVPGYTLAGKTGTAEKAIDGGYSSTDYVGSFVGFAPAEDPEFLVAVIVDSPTQGSYYGGTVAAPAFGEIATFALPYLGIEP